MIGSLMYLMNTRPDICFAVNTLSQFLTDPRNVHLITVKNILRYLRGRVDYGIRYDENQKMKSKHIEIKYHYIRDMVQRGAVKLQYVETKKQIADVLMKPLARVKFEHFREKLGVLYIEVPSKEK